MEPYKHESNEPDWVDARMAQLEPDTAWEPNAARGLARLRQSRSEMNRRRSRWALPVAAGLIACVSLAATPVTRAFAQRCLSACVSQGNWLASLVRWGGPGSAPSNVYIRPADRRPAPDFTLDDANGTPVKLSDFRGKVVLLNFWATWCSPCRIEIPMLEGFQDSYRDRGFVVLGVSQDDDGWKSVTPFAAARKINYPVVIGNDRISDAYGGPPAVPTTLLIDRQGRIAATHVGLCNRTEYEGDIQALLNE